MYNSIGIEQLRRDITLDSKYLDLSLDGQASKRVYLSRQRTGYGYKNFMICPICGTRHVELYLYQEKLMCRKCYPENVYSGIQNRTKGGYANIGYRMHRYAATHNIPIKRFPFNYVDNEKPKNIKESSWVKHLIVLQTLENMRYQAYAYHKEWSSKTIKSILTWNNSLMYIFDLSEIQDRHNLIHWDNGVDMNINL